MGPWPCGVLLLAELVHRRAKVVNDRNLEHTCPKEKNRTDLLYTVHSRSNSGEIGGLQWAVNCVGVGEDGGAGIGRRALGLLRWAVESME